MASWRRHPGTALRNLMGGGGLFLAVVVVAAEEKLALIPEDFSLWNASLLWDKSFTVRTGVGYKDNVALSHFQPQASPFFASGLDVTVIRLPADNWQFLFFLTGDDRRYWQSPGVDKEQTLMALTRIEKNLAEGWKAGLSAQYIFLDQIQDVSLSAAQLFSARVVGHTLMPTLFLRRDFSTNYWGQVDLAVTRQLLKRPLDNYWQAGPKLTLARQYGWQSDVRLSYSLAKQLYDTWQRTDADGFETLGGLELWLHKAELVWQHHWDEQRRWRTTTTLGFDCNLDNGAGFYDYQRYRLAGDLRYRAGSWEFRAKADFSYYGSPVRTVLNPDLTSSTTKFHRSSLVVSLRAEKRLARFLKIYGEYEHERSLSNEVFDEYAVNMFTGGLQWEF